MNPNQFKLAGIACAVTLGVSTMAGAAPWIDTQDPYLKASVTALANAGIITTPVNTYPLMYKSLYKQVSEAHNGNIPQHLLFALKHIEHSLKHAKAERTSGVKIKAASDTKDFQSFGERHNTKFDVNLFNEHIGKNWAFKLDAHWHTKANGNKNRSYEGSYLAGMIGNWVVSADQVSSWWGPGNDTTLALSNNATAFPAVRLTRHNSEPLDWPILNLLGPMSFTTYFGVQEHSNVREDIRLWECTN